MAARLPFVMGCGGNVSCMSLQDNTVVVKTWTRRGRTSGLPPSWQTVPLTIELQTDNHFR